MDIRPPSLPLTATHLESPRRKSPQQTTPATRLESHPYASAYSIPFRMTSLRKNPGGGVSNRPRPNLTSPRFTYTHQASPFFGGRPRDLDPKLQPRRPLVSLH